MVPTPDNGVWLGIKEKKSGISLLTPNWLAPILQSLPPMLHIFPLIPIQSCSKGARGSFRLTTVTRHLNREFNFTESMLETVGKSLRHSCRSELTRQGISLP